MRQPLRIALERAGGDLAHRVGERNRRLHARHLPERPGEPVGLDQRLVLEAALLPGLDDHRELVGGQRVVGRDVRVVAVVARVARAARARPGSRSPICKLRADREARRRRAAQRHADRGQSPSGRVVKRSSSSHTAPSPRPRVSSRSSRRLRCGRRRADAGVGEQHRQQQQVGEDQHGDADARGERQLADHRDVDDHQHAEAHGVGEQRGQPGEEQAAERVARGDQPVRAAADVLHDAVHLLRAVRHADREHEERHQDRERVELEAQQRDQPELPDDGDERAGDDQRGAAHAARVGDR